MNDTRRLLIDIAVGVGLPIVLLWVFLFDRLTATRTSPSSNTLDVVVVQDVSRQGGPRALSLGVVPTHSHIDPMTMQTVLWDDMGKLLTEMGEGYNKFEIITPKRILDDPELFPHLDVLFLTCAPQGEEFRSQLREFVNRGGTLYASDWRYDVVAAAFPEYVDPGAKAMGVQQDVDAEVVDPGLKELIGPRIHLRFDLDQWKTSAFLQRKAEVLVQGNFRKQQHLKDFKGVPSFAPLLVKFQHGKGTVIFTSFHNEKQNSETEKKLLQYLVFRLVLANIDAGIASTITEAGFAPQPSNLLSTPKGNPTVTKTYQTQKAGPLRFALGFRNEGAKLRLQIQSPEGKAFTWEGTGTVVLEVPQASVGLWTYTVTALSLPYENFPFTVTVGEKK